MEKAYGGIMTLQQLKYMIAIAENGTLSKAAEQSFISQPSLSESLKELEKELGIQLFTRTNRGLLITTDGSEFLAYARQVVEQYSLLEGKYIKKENTRKKFAISTQHYSFAVKAFIEMAKRFNIDEYNFAIRETKTHEVIDDVREFRSELGILYLNTFNKKILGRFFKDYNLEFHPLFSCRVYVYLWEGHPLRKNECITLEELQEYPHLSFEQGIYNSFYFAEEVLSDVNYKQVIKANDRATMLNLMKGLNAYTLCSGIISEDLNGGEYRAIPLDSEEMMEIGYIKKDGIPVSELGTIYLKELKHIYECSEDRTF